MAVCNQTSHSLFCSSNYCSHFRSNVNYDFHSEITKRYGIEFHGNFFEPGEGKGPLDREFGLLSGCTKRYLQSGKQIQGSVAHLLEAWQGHPNYILHQVQLDRSAHDGIYRKLESTKSHGFLSYGFDLEGNMVVSTLTQVNRRCHSLSLLLNGHLRKAEDEKKKEEDRNKWLYNKRLQRLERRKMLGPMVMVEIRLLHQTKPSRSRRNFEHVNGVIK
jgi:hypothetical protein